ncbi:MAG: hypothetical protein R6W82_08905 [bacterium]
MDRLILRQRVLISALGLLLSTTSGCGLFDSDPGLYFNTGALRPGRLLLATHPVDTFGSDVSLYTLTVSGTTRFSVYASGVGDPASPHIVQRPSGGWLLGYGWERITVRSSIGDVEHTLSGRGARQRGIALDPTGSGRLAFMDGSASGGYDISYRSSPGGRTVALTEEASPGVSCWTPSWSHDGRWILYARIAGTTGEEAELWRVHPDGTGAEQLPITTVELPTYAIFSPDGNEVFVPGDFTSYRVSDGAVGTIDRVRETQDFRDQLSDLGYSMVGSPLTGPEQPGGPTTAFRHTFPISADWTGDNSEPIYFDALVASSGSGGDPPELAGAAIFSWHPVTRTLVEHVGPVRFPDSFTEGWSISILHPTLIP